MLAKVLKMPSLQNAANESLGQVSKKKKRTLKVLHYCLVSREMPTRMQQTIVIHLWGGGKSLEVKPPE